MFAKITSVFGTISSWSALFCENQIWSQAITAEIWNIWGFAVVVPILSGLRIIKSHSAISVIFKARISISQKDCCQTTRAIGQEKKRWIMESTRQEHWEQVESTWEERRVLEILNLVGRIFQINFQRNNLKRWLKYSFHKDFQLGLGRG